MRGAIGRAARAAAVAVLALVAAAEAFGETDARLYLGTISYVAPGAVEVSGRRAIFAPGSTVTSDGRPVSPGSIQPGMPAELEVDPEGRVIELRVKGVVE